MPSSLAAAVARFDPLAIDPAACVASAQRFDAVRFGRSLRAEVQAVHSEERGARPDHRARRRTRVPARWSVVS